MCNDVFTDEQLVYSGSSHTLNCEDTFMSLASRGRIDRVFHANVLKMELGNKLDTYVHRVFEYGCFNGFCQIYVNKMKCQLNVENMIPGHALMYSALKVIKQETLYWLRREVIFSNDIVLLSTL